MKNEILIALKDSFVDQSEYNNEIISKLNKRVETLRGRISNIYMDKLDKKLMMNFGGKNITNGLMRYLNV